MVGTLLEYYDFAAYNSLAALVFGALFFSASDPMSGAIFAFSTFAVGYAARPIGGIVFGRLGDRRGRRFVLTATLLVMGSATVLIVLLPTYASAGRIAPLLLIASRFVQGAALGGEWAGAVLLSFEHSAPPSRGLNAAWAQMGPSLGTLLATGLIASMTYLLRPEQFQSWGWRVPFLVSVGVAGFGLWIRTGVEETPVFSALKARHADTRAPIQELLSKYWRRLLIAGGSRVGADVMYSLLASFSLTYLTAVRQQSRSSALLAVSIGVAVNAMIIPWCGRLSDWLGRRAVCAAGALLAIGWGFAFFRLLDGQDPLTITLAVAGGFAIHALMYGPQAAFIVEQFPTHVRYAGASLAYTWVGLLGGGLAPLLFATLWRSYHRSLALSLYLAAALCITCLALLLADETARRPLED